MDNQVYEPLKINLEKILLDSNYSTITKDVIKIIKKHDYMSVGDFFTNLTNSDLTALNCVCEIAFRHNDDKLKTDLLVITCALQLAEGVEPISDSEQASNVAYFCDLIQIETLARREFVNAFRENFSFGQDMRHKVIVENLLG